MIIYTGVSGRQTQERSLGWEGGGIATRRTYAPGQTETRTDTERGLCFAASRAPCSHPASRIDGARQHERPTGSAARAPHALRVCGEHCDEIRCGRLGIRGSSWICGVNGCNVARRNEKTASRRVLRKGWCFQHQTFEVTGSREPCYQNTS